jgi:hypothetical protein
MTGIYSNRYLKQLISRPNCFWGEGSVSFAGSVTYCYHHVEPCRITIS